MSDHPDSTPKIGVCALLLWCAYVFMNLFSSTCSVHSIIETLYQLIWIEEFFFFVSVEVPLPKSMNRTESPEPVCGDH